MKYFGSISENNDLVTKKYVDDKVAENSGTVVKDIVEILQNNITSISIPIPIIDTDSLTVYHNGILLIPAIHYTATTSTITLNGYSARRGDIFTFVATTQAGINISPTAGNTTILDTDNNYPGVNTVEAALKYVADHWKPVIDGIKLNGESVTPINKIVALANILLTTNVQLNGVSITPTNNIVNIDLSDYLTKTNGGALSAPLVAQSNESYNTKQVRNIIIGTTDPDANIGANGDIYIKYSI